MRLDFQHFRTKLGQRIVLLFVLCALLPTVGLSFFSYQRVRSELRDQSTAQMQVGTTDAQMGALERLQSVESELILLAASPNVTRAFGGASSGWSAPEIMRRLDALTLATPTAIIPIVGDLTDLPELHPETLANLDDGESALAVVRGPGNRPNILMARAPEGADTDEGVLWGRIVEDSLWTTAQVYAIGVAANEINLQDAIGYCVLDETGQPLDCAGAIVVWAREGVPGDVQISGNAVHGPLSWTEGDVTYAGYYRRLFLGGFNGGDWTIVLASDERAVLEPLAEFQNALVGFVVLTTMFVLLLSG